MMNPADYPTRLTALARRAVSGGCVLLRNERSALPLEEGLHLAVFGVAQMHYYPSGLGSGGLVNTRGMTGVFEALERSGLYALDSAVRNAYCEWEKAHPFSAGDGWSRHPWAQPEMPVTDRFVSDAAARNDAAIVLIGRTAGEDKDNADVPGSWQLTDEETLMISCVSRYFARTIVLLNVGNIMDMGWVTTCTPAAVMYIWQGGEEGGDGVVDVLSGRVAPTGRLADTIAASAADYPSLGGFGNDDRLIYDEDIFVGYRYFETFAPDRVLYPFGTGLSYTTFAHTPIALSWNGETVTLRHQVINTGAFPSGEVVQVYVQAPVGALGKPSRVLCAFDLTADLAPGEACEVTLTAPASALASYDDTGRTGHPHCYVLEAGEYRFFAGHDVRTAVPAGAFTIRDTLVLFRAEEAAAPQIPFRRLTRAADGSAVREDVPTSTHAVNGLRVASLPAEIPPTGPMVITLGDVADGQATLAAFVAQLSDEDLCCIVRGEGMSSPRVTPGTAGAIGGVSDVLTGLGIPAVCCADGPSGIRMDCSNIAFYLPCGTALACTWNTALIRDLFAQEALDLRKNRIDMLLGPGMNIHRTPLGGRNFEYFSEDPLLTGRMAAAELQGLHTGDVTGVIKHFACNGQEHSRRKVEAVVSERALRAIYLRGYEIAVREGGAWAIMTSYNPINGVWAASSHDLLTRVLRGEWGFDGVVMTDWWAYGSNDSLYDPSPSHVASMIRAQNDLFMVANTPAANSGNDDSAQSLADGSVTRAEYQRSAMNILRAVMRTPAFRRSRGLITDLDRALSELRDSEGGVVLHMNEIPVDFLAHVPGSLFGVGRGQATLFQAKLARRGVFAIRLRVRAAEGLPDTAQASLALSLDNRVMGTVTVSGAQRDWQTLEFHTGEIRRRLIFYVRTFTPTGGIEVDGMEIELEREVEMM